MPQSTEAYPKDKKQARRWPLLAPLVVIAILIAVASFLVGMNRSQMNVLPASTQTANAMNQCTTLSASQWSPVGAVWNLTVKFLSGSRQNSSEISQMTFLPNGLLTATFPGATPSAPPALPPVVDGRWCFTGQNAFHYQFRDVLSQGGKVVAYVQTELAAYLTSPTTYEAGGVGVVYDAKTGQPVQHAYNVSQTTAVASGK